DSLSFPTRRSSDLELTSSSSSLMAARTCSSGCAQEENSPSRSATYPSSETIIEYSSLPMALLRVRPAHSLCAGTAADQPVTTDADSTDGYCVRREVTCGPRP